MRYRLSNNSSSERLRMKKISRYKRCLASVAPASCVVFLQYQKIARPFVMRHGVTKALAPTHLNNATATRRWCVFGKWQRAHLLVATDVAARVGDIKSLELVVNYELASGPGGACPSYWPYGARGSSGLAYQFRAPEEYAAGKYSFRNAATQTELAECARPAASLFLWPQRWLPYG